MNIRTLIFGSCLALCAALPAAAADRAETLRAINWVENPTNHSRRGSKGELGPYQFRAETWRMHTKKPFSLAVVREHADEVAIKHYDWIKRGLTAAGIDPSPFNIALAWNSGLGAVLSGRVPTITYNYAERVHNLVETQRMQREHLRRQLASVSTPPVPTVASSKNSDLTVRFSLEPAAPRFVIQTGPDPLEPVVYTRETVERPTTAVAINLDAPVFTLPSAAAPRFALIQ